MTVTTNEKEKRIEVRFASRPRQETIDNLKLDGWRWSSSAECWYKADNRVNRKSVEKIHS